MANFSLCVFGKPYKCASLEPVGQRDWKFLSGKSQGILNSDVCGTNAYNTEASIRLGRFSYIIVPRNSPILIYALAELLRKQPRQTKQLRSLVTR